jgi:hypothetical protein
MTFVPTPLLSMQELSQLLGIHTLMMRSTLLQTVVTVITVVSTEFIMLARAGSPRAESAGGGAYPVCGCTPGGHV